MYAVRQSGTFPQGKEPNIGPDKGYVDSGRTYRVYLGRVHILCNQLRGEGGKPNAYVF